MYERSLHMSLTKEEKLLGDLFRDAIYTATTTSEFLELFSLKILENFDSDDFLILQLGSQLYESAQIRKTDELYMDMQTKITTECYNLISKKYPEISFYSSQRFKSAISEIYKRCERVFDEGRSPEIRDLLASKIVLLESETQETLGYEYKIVSETMKHFSYLNTRKEFPIAVNLAGPDKLVFLRKNIQTFCSLIKKLLFQVYQFWAKIIYHSLKLMVIRLSTVHMNLSINLIPFERYFRKSR